jgi:hypothetical protein
MTHRSSRKFYSPLAFASAVSAAKKPGRASLLNISSTFGVTASTLRNHISGFQRDGIQRILHLGATSGPATVLSVRSEARLVELIALSRRLCNTVDKTHILQKAAEVEATEARAQNRELSGREDQLQRSGGLGSRRGLGWCCGAAKTQTWTDSRARHQRSSQGFLPLPLFRPLIYCISKPPAKGYELPEPCL